MFYFNFLCLLHTIPDLINLGPNPISFSALIRQNPRKHAIAHRYGQAPRRGLNDLQQLQLFEKSNQRRLRLPSDSFDLEGQQR